MHDRIFVFESIGDEPTCLELSGCGMSPSNLNFETNTLKIQTMYGLLVRKKKANGQKCEKLARKCKFKSVFSVKEEQRSGGLYQSTLCAVIEVSTIFS